MKPAAAELATELEELTELLYLIPVGIAQIDAAGTISFINPLAVQLLMPVVRSGNPLSNLFDALAAVAPDLRTIVSGFDHEQGDILRDYRIMVSAGTALWSDPVVYAISLVKLDAARIMVALQDISESVRRERMIQQQEAWINAVLQGVTDHAITLLDAQGRVSQWNEGLRRLAGFDEGQVVGRSCALLFSGDAVLQDRLQDRLHEASADGLSLDEGWMARADGSRFWGHTVIMPRAPGLQSDGFAMVIRNVTDQRQSTESLLRTANCDQLTGLANRRSFFDALELEVTRYQRRPRPLSLLLIDIDRFGQINANHGPAAGDAVIRDLVGVLSASVRDVDIVARIGGEKFAVLLPSTAPDAAHTVAERILQAAALRTVDHDGAGIAYTVSGGIAAMDKLFTGSATLFEAADRALCAAKRAGRNRICVA